MRVDLFPHCLVRLKRGPMGAVARGLCAQRSSWPATARKKPRFRSCVPLKYVSKRRPESTLEMAVEEAKAAYRNERTWRGTEDLFVCNVAAGIEVLLSRRSLASGREYTVVSFCGTERMTDWTCNFMMYLADSVDPCSPMASAGRVHAGFLARWRSIKDKLCSALRRVCGERAKLLVTGHSLGGALAALAANDIAAALPDATLEVVTFGAPMFADARYNARLQHANITNAVRCVHVGDFVQHLPPLPSYTHPTFGELVVVGERRHAVRHTVRRDIRTGLRAIDNHPVVRVCVRLWQNGLDIRSHDVMQYWQAIVDEDVRRVGDGASHDRACGA